jgi:hypothetical protein
MEYWSDSIVDLRLRIAEFNYELNLILFGHIRNPKSPDSNTPTLQYSIIYIHHQRSKLML